MAIDWATPLETTDGCPVVVLETDPATGNRRVKAGAFCRWWVRPSGHAVVSGNPTVRNVAADHRDNLTRIVTDIQTVTTTLLPALTVGNATKAQRQHARACLQGALRLLDELED